jgi:hypothetical protein
MRRVGASGGVHAAVSLATGCGSDRARVLRHRSGMASGSARRADEVIE